MSDEYASDSLRLDAVRVRSTGALIGMSPCPGTLDFPLARPTARPSLAADLDALVAWGAVAVVTLNRIGEPGTVPLADLWRAVNARGMTWYHLAIFDGGAPDTTFETHWATAGAHLRRVLWAGRNILLHCRGGLGRSGTIAARLLVELGENPRVAVDRVRRARGGAIETPVQEAHVLACVALPRPTTP
jgi:rhodanese/phosphatase family protein